MTERVKLGRWSIPRPASTALLVVFYPVLALLAVVAVGVALFVVFGIPGMIIQAFSSGGLGMQGPIVQGLGWLVVAGWAVALSCMARRF